MSDNVKFIPVITQNLDGFAKQDGQIVVDVANNKIAVDVNSERFVVADKSPSSISYDNLENKPIINIDLSTSGFTPVLGQYYKHIGADIILEGTEFDPTAQYSRIYFNTNLSNEAVFNYISSNFDFVSSEGRIKIKIANLKVDNEDFLDLWLDKDSDEEFGDTIYLGNSGYYMRLFNLVDTSLPYGWNNGNRFGMEGGDWGPDYLAFISEGAVTFTVETTADATKLKKLISPTPFTAYLKDAIYKCTSLSPLTYEKVLTSADLINYHDAAKQDRINYFGDGLDYNTEYSELSVDFDKVAKKADLNNKQDKLTAGNNISIANNIISTTFPTPPTMQGMYTLKCTVDGFGNVTYTWETL